MVTRKTLDIRFGDIVQFSYFVDLLGHMKNVFGRVHGKVSNRTTGLLLGKEDYYVLKPDPSHDEEEVQDDLMEYFLIGLEDDQLEWGKLPSHPYVTVPASGVGSLFGPNMLSKFKKEGLCPRCGDRGEWKVMALVCPYHGIYI